MVFIPDGVHYGWSSEFFADGVYCGSSSFRMEFISDGVHSGLSTLRMEFIPDGVHSGWRLFVCSGTTVISLSCRPGLLVCPLRAAFVWMSSFRMEFTLDEVLSGWSSGWVETFCLFFNYSHFAQLSTRTTGVPSEAVFILDGGCQYLVFFSRRTGLGHWSTASGCRRRSRSSQLTPHRFLRGGVGPAVLPV